MPVGLVLERLLKTSLMNLAAGFAVADSCTTSTISLPTPTDGAEQISLEITGCSNFTGISNLTNVARVNLYKNNFTELDLASLRITDQIRIADNPNLETIVLPDPRPGQTVSLPPTGADAPQWTVVEIVDNPRLDTDNIKYQGSANFWDWGVRNFSSFALSGGNFHSNFFYPISTSAGDYPESGHVYVTDSFVLNSTDSTYDCSYLNSLKYQGSIKGNYTCQGRTVVPSIACSFLKPRDVLWGVVVAAIMFVGLL
ncbi:hypothetical protein F4804DRAFT_344376 [Jackrogersella minutella]|nr:hypothetical protein F4804DRAFT_344376 [Jackrogersella minutella]